MRIGIVGAAGTGKTTLAKALAAALGSTLVPDFVPIVLREHGKESWRQVHDWRTSRVVRFSAVERKIAAERAATSFVSDRTVVDYLAYWLHNQAEHETADQNAAFLAMVREHAPRYDRCVVLPWREKIDAGGYRTTDPMHNLKIAALKRGLLAVLGVPVVEAPYVFGEDVHAWVKRWLEAPAPSEAPLAAQAQAPALLAPSAPALPAALLPPALPEIDEAEIVRRVVEQACLALAERQPAPGPAAAAPEPRDEHEVWKLDRRVEKLARALSDTEERLRGMIAAKTVDTGIASVYKTVQGLSSEEPGYERKKGLLHDIFLQNVDLQKNVGARRARRASAATEAIAATAAIVFREEEAKDAQALVETAPLPAEPAPSAPSGFAATATLGDAAPLDDAEKAF